VCCNLPCQGQCQACDIENKLGLCSELGTIANPVPSKRKPCDGEGTECSGFCDGQNPSACTYPNGTPCQEPSCSCPEGDCSKGGDEILSKCNGKAACVSFEIPCKGFRCDAELKQCNTNCASDDDCIRDFTCEGEGTEKSCKPLKGPKCYGDTTVKIPMQADKTCEKYKCSGTDCLTTCQSVSDCLPPYVCNTKGECVNPPTGFDLSPSCSLCASRPVGSGDAGLMGGIVVAAISTVLAAARRRARLRR
jgi:hypothetical protein